MIWKRLKISFQFKKNIGAPVPQNGGGIREPLVIHNWSPGLAMWHITCFSQNIPPLRVKGLWGWYPSCRRAGLYYPWDRRVRGKQKLPDHCIAPVCQLSWYSLQMLKELPMFSWILNTDLMTPPSVSWRRDLHLKVLRCGNITIKLSSMNGAIFSPCHHITFPGVVNL